MVSMELLVKSNEMKGGGGVVVGGTCNEPALHPRWRYRDLDEPLNFNITSDEC